MIDEILNLLDKVKRVGTGKWQACCPVHGDKNPSMSVAEKDGKVLCHCFACGANGHDVVRAVGLPASALFNDSQDASARHTYRTEILLNEKWSDELFIQMYKKAEDQGQYIKLSDRKRYKLATNRLQGIDRVINS